MASRPYNSAVREQGRDETHQRIFDATVRVVLEQGVHAFTIRNVAVAAGVAHRTVYRHFPTRELLLEGIAQTMEPEGDPAEAVPPVVEWERVLASTHAEMAANRDRVRAVYAASVALQHPLHGRGVRSARFRVRLAEAFPSLPPDTCTEAANVIRNVLSSTNWLSLTVEHGMSDEAALRASTWALRALLADLAARDRAAQESP